MSVRYSTPPPAWRSAMTVTGPGFRRLRFLLPFAAVACAIGAAAAAPPTFAVKRLINTPVNGLLPFDVRTVDMDADGDLDVYTANYSGRVGWYENDGAVPPGPWHAHTPTDVADGA